VLPRARSGLEEEDKTGCWTNSKGHANRKYYASRIPHNVAGSKQQQLRDGNFEPLRRLEVDCQVWDNVWQPMREVPTTETEYR
jgi:hypothetical protein